MTKNFADALDENSFGKARRLRWYRFGGAIERRRFFENQTVAADGATKWETH